MSDVAPPSGHEHTQPPIVPLDHPPAPESAASAALPHPAAELPPVAAAAEPAGERSSLVEALIGPFATFGMLVAVGGTQGGYFPEMWGPSTVILLGVLVLWAIVSGRVDLGRVDLAWGAVLFAITGWVALSLLWTTTTVQTVLELQRLVMMVVGFSVVIVLARRASAPYMTLALALGATALAAYGLATRLLPGHLGTAFEPINGYRLAEPIGYWNGLGIVAALGLLLALGSAAEIDSAWARVVGAISTVPLAAALYFTFSRGAWVALGIGLAVTALVSHRRLATLGSWALLLVAPALAVLAASHYPALRRTDAPIDAATTEGRRLLLVLVLVGALAALVGLALHVLSQRLDVSPNGRRALGVAALVVLAAALAVGVAQVGAPWSAAADAIEAFKEENTSGGANLNDRLFNLSGSGRVDLWRTAGDVGSEHAVVGAGAGTFERAWQQDPRWSFKARDAHSLYLETWAELGIVGLALVLALVAIPAVACLRRRRTPTVAAALGTLAAFAAHAGVDWDWEIPAITLIGFGSGLVGVIALRSSEVRQVHRAARAVGIAGGAAVAAGAVLAFIGNDAQRRAEYALDVDRPSVALSEADIAERFAPWSPYPHTVAGEAHLRLRQVRAARESFEAAVDTDPTYWRAWLGLAVASEGKARAAALREATRLYPRSAEIEKTKELLRSGS